MLRACALAFVVLVALTGCTFPESDPTSAESQQPSASPSAGSDPSVEPEPEPEEEPEAWTPSGSAVDPALYGNDVDGMLFTSPSGKVQCWYSTEFSTSWGCLVPDQTVELPPDPGGECTGTYLGGAPIVPNGFIVSPGGSDAAPVTICAGITPGIALPYGSSLTYRDMACDSTESGMICRSLLSGSGFRLSKSDYEIH